MKRRTVHKITPAKQSTFDQQFWPVLVALTVLCSIAVGAVVTILRGPWMWGSLFVLPLLAAGAIFLLFNLDSQKLRRSLQFAIILSLAIHLMVMVFASVINIFQNPYKPNERQVAQRPVRTIEISDQRAAFVWEEANSRETPEPDVVPEKVQRPTTTNAKPQTVPVQEKQPDITPQLVKRETAAPSVPRQNPELSQLRKQTRAEVQPQSSEKATGQKVASKSNPNPTQPDTKVESSKQADSVAKQAVAKTETQVQPADAKPANSPEMNKPEVVRSASSPRRTETTKPPVISAPQPSPSQARVRRNTPDIPVATQKATAAEKVASAATSKPVEAEPSKSADQVTRRPSQSRTAKPTVTNKPKTEFSPKSQIARTVNRRQPNPVRPTISTDTSVTMTPRRAVADTTIAVSPVPIEKPSRSPESKTASRELNSKTLSVSRSTQGVAGVGRSKNLDRYVGGINSPAVRASDSARRERSMSNSTANRMLSSSQKSQVRRTVGAVKLPTSAFKAETSSAAKIAGAKTTGERTMESSAARIDSRTADARDEVSAERGTAAVDLGPTKIVMDQTSPRRSGGGQPDVSQLDPDSTRRSKDRSDAQPSLVAELSPNVLAPRNQSAMTPSTQAVEASDKATFAARTGGEAAVTAERWAADIDGEFSNQGESNLADQLGENRQRANRNESVTSWNADEDDDEDEENLRGTRRTQIARAPIIRSDPGFGTAPSDGVSQATPAQAGDSPTESLAVKVQRQASSALPGSGMGQTATNALLQAATSLPIIESSPGRRTGSGKTTKVDPDLTSGLANHSKTRGSLSTKPDVAPTLSGVASIEPTNAGNNRPRGVATAELERLDSSDVSVKRADLESMERIQGSVLDIQAMEGAAGLGVRPDEFIGVLNRPSSKDSKQLQPDFDNRFKNEKFGGTPSINPDAVIAKEAFRNRSPSAMASAAEPTTEAAIHLGLEFLARYQSADGSWALSGFDRDEPQNLTQLNSDTAATGLALLAFQGAGYNHREFKYARQIDHALQWLMENQSADGGLYVPSNNKSDNACRLYSHGIAALALTEAYGMTQDVRLKDAAQKALDYIAQTQDARKGGWRYFDTPGKKSSDTSVSGWMMMALQSGRLAGLRVDQSCFDGIDDWLDVAVDPDNKSLYRYNPYAKDSKGVSRIQGRKPSASMTSVGLLMRIYSGWDKTDPRLLAGADYLIETQLPTDATPLQRDTYYWYYATQVIKHVGGPRWDRWNNELRPLLTRSQETSGDFAGSWHPYKPVPDRWGAFGGRIYVTTMNLLSLEVRHRMLPIYREPGEPPALVGVIETETISTTTPEPAKKRPAVPRKPVVIKEPDPGDVPKAPPKLNPKRVIVKRPSYPERANPNKPATKPPAANLNRAPAPSTEPKKVNAKNKPVMIELPEPGGSQARKAAGSIDVTSLNPVPNITRPTPMIPRVNRDLDPTASANISPKADLLPPTQPDMEQADFRPDFSLAKPPRNLASKKNRLPDIQPTLGAPTNNRVPNKTNPLTPKAAPVKLYGSVAGRITMDGKVLRNAKIEFVPVDRNGEKISARTDSNGAYTIASTPISKQLGVKAGKYKVSITTFVESPNEDVIDFLEIVPDKYNSKTTLQVSIAAGKPQKLDLNISSK